MSSVAETIKDLDDALLDALAERAVSIVWTHAGGIGYDIPTGRTLEASVDTVLTCVAQHPANTLQPTQEERSPVRFIIRLVELGTFRVKIGDNILYSGMNWKVYGVETPDPGASQLVDARRT